MRTVRRFTTCFMVSICLPLAAFAQAEIWVAPDGSDAAGGTEREPLGSLAMAVRKARELRRVNDPSVAEGVRIVLREGVHRLEDAVRIRPEDSGSADRPLLIEAAPGASPVLSGGIEIGGWERVSGDSGNARMWVADAPRFRGRALEFRQLWVNGRKAIRSREPDGDDMFRLIEWRRAEGEAVVPAAALAGLNELDGVEMFLLQQWEIAVLRLKSARIEGERATARFHDPESRIQSEHPWPQPIMSETFRAPFFFMNALEFLDEPGEWFLDRVAGKVCYLPREGEDMARAVVVAPALETLVEIRGNVDRRVAHVVFRGIRFQHTTWLRPSLEGHVPLQAGFPMLEAYKLNPKGTPEWRSLDNQGWLLRPPGAVEVGGADAIRFEGCRFEHLAMTGLDFVTATRGDVVEGCVFSDIGGNGIQIGSFQDGADETHLPYDPSDEREVCGGGRIADNLVSDCGNEDWGCVGIAAGYARDLVIEHNEVFDLPYSGISLGWGWTRSPNAMRRNIVRANHIHHVSRRMCDTAGIYTLSAQPGTMIVENAIESITLASWVEKPHWGYIYLDEGSAFMVVRDNWCEGGRFVRNANGPGNVWENNGPDVAEEIRRKAGPRKEEL